MERFIAAALALAFVAAPVAGRAADSASLAQRLMSKLQWRSIGPYIGGRVVAVAGVPSEPNLFYMGGVQGGVWKSTNYGLQLDEHHRRQDSRHRRSDRRARGRAVEPERHLRRHRRDRHPRRLRHRRRHLQDDRRRQDVDVRRPARHAHDRQARDRPARPERRLRGFDGTRLQAERRARRLQNDRRRQDVAQGSLRRRQDRRRSTS